MKRLYCFIFLTKESPKFLSSTSVPRRGEQVRTFLLPSLRCPAVREGLFFNACALKGREQRVGKESVEKRERDREGRDRERD